MLLLENLRFHPEEKRTTQDFAESSARWRVYVNDAFGTCSSRGRLDWRCRARTAHAVSGLLVQKELRDPREELEKPARPFIGILGGAKVSDKIGFIDRLLGKANTS